NAGAAAGAVVADEGGKGRHALAVQQHRLVVADRRGGQRRGREDDRSDVVTAEVVAVRGLELRTQHVERLAVGRLGDRAVAGQALQQAGDVGARALLDEL